MAMIPRIQKKPKPPVPPPVPTYTINQMKAFGWLRDMPLDYRGAIPRTPDPRIPSGIDPHIDRKDPTLKATTLQSFLEECRAAKTSDEIGLVVDQIESKIGTMRADRAKTEGQLQEAIVAGRDPGKIHTAVAETDRDLMTLEAARAGFSQKQADVRKHEEGNALRDLQLRYDANGEKLTAKMKEAAARIEAARATYEEVAAIVKQRDQMFAELQSAGEHPKLPASAIVRSVVGEVRRGDGVSEYGRRVDIGLAEFFRTILQICAEAQVMRRGRVGETNLAKDLATERWMNLAKAAGG